MSTMSHRRVVATLATGALLGLPAVSLADSPARDYSQNSVNGVFAEPRHDSSGVTPIHSQIGPAATPGPTSSSDGFAWGDAAAGAGIALLITGGVGLGGRMVARRHRSVAGATP